MIETAKIVSVKTDPDVYFAHNPGGNQRGGKDYVMSRSDLMEFFHCPNRWRKGYKNLPSDAKDYGSLLDCYLLDKNRFDSKYSVAPDEYYNENKGMDMPWNYNAKFCKEWRAEELAKGKVSIKEGDMDGCRAAGRTMLDDKIINSLLKDSDTQVMIEAEWHSKSGRKIPLKALLDIVPKKGTMYEQHICDLKTCRSASPEKWSREVFNYGYHVQAAFYIDMYYAATGESRDWFAHILQESYEPYEIGRRLISEDFIEIGREKYESAMALYCDCLKSDKWPGYDDVNRNNIGGFSVTNPELWMIKP